MQRQSRSLITILFMVIFILLMIVLTGCNNKPKVQAIDQPPLIPETSEDEQQIAPSMPFAPSIPQEETKSETTKETVNPSSAPYTDPTMPPLPPEDDEEYEEDVGSNQNKNNNQDNAEVPSSDMRPPLPFG